MLYRLLQRIYFILIERQRLKERNIVFHPLAYRTNSRCSKYTFIDANSILVNSSLGSYSYISRNSQVLWASVGRYCSIGSECKIGMGSHPTNLISTSPVFFSRSNKIGVSVMHNENYEEFQPINIGNDVWIGSRVMVMGGCNIGNGAIVGSGAVVTKDVEPYSIVGGIPAKKIKMRFDPKLIGLLENSKWWELNHQQLQDIYDLVSDDGGGWKENTAMKVSKLLAEKNGTS